MSNPALQAKAQALNAKLEGEAESMLDGIEKKMLRPLARASYQCVVKCFDKAGSTGPSEALQQCSRNCQIPHQRGNEIVQEETNQFQQRLSRSMMECQDQARDMLGVDVSSSSSMQPDPTKIAKAENAMLKCIEKTVDAHIKLLMPMRKRIEGQLKQQQMNASK